MDPLKLQKLKNNDTGDIKKQWLNQNQWVDSNDPKAKGHNRNKGTHFAHTSTIEGRWGQDDEPQGKFDTPLQPSMAMHKPKTSDDQPPLTRFDTFGIIRPGSWVQQGSTLVGKRKRAFDTKKTPEEQLLYDIFTSRSKNVRQRGGGKTTELWTDLSNSTAIEDLRDSSALEGKAITSTPLEEPSSPWGESAKLSSPPQDELGEQRVTPTKSSSGRESSATSVPQEDNAMTIPSTDSTLGVYDITENGQFKDTSFVLSHDVDARVLQTYFFPDANPSVGTRWKKPKWPSSASRCVSTSEREGGEIAYPIPQTKVKSYDRSKVFEPSGRYMPSVTGLRSFKAAPKGKLQGELGGQWQSEKQWPTFGTFHMQKPKENHSGRTADGVWHWVNDDKQVEKLYHHQKGINHTNGSGSAFLKGDGYNESKETLTNGKHSSNTGTVIIYLIIKRPIEIGDKLAGRHGNKGIVSNILPEEDMPYLSDGTPLEILLNPLGVPSRMNVGQVYECLLGMAGAYLNEYYRLKPFDESYGHQTSRALVYSKLFQASKGNRWGETRSHAKANGKEAQWIFHGSHPGKTKVFDGRSGEVFEHPMTVGVSYIMKLVHLVDEKMHARSTGPYSLITQQPLKGRSKHGGQRLGEMEVWAFESFGASYLLQEMMTLKSDDIYGRNQAFRDILRKNPVKQGSIPESFRVLAYELRALCFDVFYIRN